MEIYGTILLAPEDSQNRIDMLLRRGKWRGRHFFGNQFDSIFFRSSRFRPMREGEHVQHQDVLHVDRLQEAEIGVGCGFRPLENTVVDLGKVFEIRARRGSLAC